MSDEIKVGDIVSANPRAKHPLSWLVLEVDEKNQIARLRSGLTGYRKWMHIDRLKHWSPGNADE